MTSSERILNQLLTVKYATINNIFYRTAQSLKGSRLPAYKTFRKLLEKDLIRSIPYNEFTRNPQIERFYYLTPKGELEIGIFKNRGLLKDRGPRPLTCYTRGCLMLSAWQDYITPI